MREEPRPPENQLPGLTVQVSTPNTIVQPGSDHDSQHNAASTPATQKRTCNEHNEDFGIPPKKTRLQEWLAADVDIEASINVYHVSSPSNQDEASTRAKITGNDVSQAAEHPDTESELLSDANSDDTHPSLSGHIYDYPVATSIYGFTLEPETIGPPRTCRCHFFGNQGKGRRISYDPSKHFRFLQGKDVPRARYEDMPGPGTVVMQDVGYVFGSDPKKYSAYDRAPTTQLETDIRDNGWLRAYALTTHYIEKNVDFLVGYTVQEAGSTSPQFVQKTFSSTRALGDNKRIVIENIAGEVATIKEARPCANVEATHQAESQPEDPPISTVNNVALTGQALWHLSAFEAPYRPAIAKYIQVLCRTAISDADSDQLCSALRELNLTNAEIVEIAEQVNGQKAKAIRGARAQLDAITRTFDSTTDLAAAQALSDDATKLLVSGAMCRSMERLESFMHAQSLCMGLMQLRLKNQEGHGGEYGSTGNEDTSMGEGT